MYMHVTCTWVKEECPVPSPHLPAAKLRLSISSNGVQDNAVLVSLQHSQVHHLHNFLCARGIGNGRHTAKVVKSIGIKFFCHTYLSDIWYVGLCVLISHKPLITNVAALME